MEHDRSPARNRRHVAGGTYTYDAKVHERMTAALLGDTTVRDATIHTIDLHLRTHLAVRIQTADLPPDVVGRFHRGHRTLTIRETAEPEDRLWLLQDVLLHLTVGAHASSGHTTRQRLRIVHSN